MSLAFSDQGETKRLTGHYGATVKWLLEKGPVYHNYDGILLPDIRTKISINIHSKLLWE